MTKKIPLPKAGLILGLFALGNLLQTYSETLRLVIGACATIMLVMYLIRIFTDTTTFKKELENPVMASVFGTMSMAMMLLAGYIKPYSNGIAVAIYYLAIAIHIILILYFTKQFILNYDVKKVFASYYIVYVGIVVGSVVAPAFGATTLGKIFFWFGLVTFIALFVQINQRYLKVGHPDKPLQPLFCITCAPASLLLAGYMQSFENKTLWFALTLMTIAQIIYFYVLVKLPGYLKETKFFPSYSAFTFPFVISAIGLKMTTGFLKKSGNLENLGFLKSLLPILVKVETIIAVLLVAYTFIRYTMHFFQAEKTN